MKILMLAPEPFFQPRGTPLSEYFRIRALSDLGHKVDLVTYHLGEDVEIENLKIVRIPNLFSIKKIKIGPSLAKIPLDFLLFLTAFFQLLKRKYDLIFSHEEAAFLGVFLAKIWKLHHVYDMHSSLPQQLENFNFTRSSVIKRTFLWIEKLILKRSQAIIVVCLDLLNKVTREGFGSKATRIENFIDFKGEDYSEEQLQKKRAMFATEGEKIVLYTGNFEPYQGMPLLLEAVAKIDEKVVFLLVGGENSEIEVMKKRAEALGIADKVVFTGKVPPEKVPSFIFLADVLVSSRLAGTNTPLKIYSYMKSGKPLVATNLWTHSQVLSDKISVLVEPNPQSLAEGIMFALSSEEAKRRAERCKELAEREYTYPSYLGKISHVLRMACKSS
ncbi:MAG: glycosyltransferase family 4 protein [Candidatus Aminicenantaceae bacterium]